MRLQGHPVVGYGQGVSLGTPLRTGLIAQWSSILHGTCKRVLHHCLRSWAFCDGPKLGTSEWAGTGLVRAWFIGKCRRNKTQARTIGETTGQNTREQHQRKGRREADRGPSTADTPAPRGRTAVMGPRAAEPPAAATEEERRRSVAGALPPGELSSHGGSPGAPAGRWSSSSFA